MQRLFIAKVINGSQYTNLFAGISYIYRGSLKKGNFTNKDIIILSLHYSLVRYAVSV